jgi:D-lactate dehydrogenase (cytochrome)
LARLNLLAPVVGHVGDGNFHCSLLIDMNDADEVARTREAITRLAQRAIRMDGTCTGEHGIGQGKIPYLEEEAGAALGVMRAIKATLDPLNILNPGKIMR